MRPGELPVAWRALAETFRRFGAESQACAVERCAEELEAAIAETADELLSLEAAALESGHTVRALRHLIATGRVPNAGKKGAPRIRRADLPLAPGPARTSDTPNPRPAPSRPAAVAPTPGGFDIDAFARGLAGGRRAS
jgi:hypothetical protein